MTASDPIEPIDPLLNELAGLAAKPPHGLIDRITGYWVRVDGPAGPLYVASTDQGIAYVRTAEVVDDDSTVFAESYRARFGRPLLPVAKPPAGLVPALRTGRTSGLRFDLRGLTEFQRAVLLATKTIPRGEIRPYAWIANRIGRPKAVRAVGSALGNNPVPILIPCHRVTLSDGSPGQYVFGPAVKQELLQVENTNVAEVQDLARTNIHYLASDTTGIVCFPSCVNARRIAPTHRHGFRTLTQAKTAGYRPCGHCQPESFVEGQSS